MPVLDMKKFQEHKKKELKKEIIELKSKGVTPQLLIITDGKDKRTDTYMKSKLKMSDELDLKAQKTVVSDIISLEKAISEHIPTICQLPIEKSLEEYYMKNIGKTIDVDCFDDCNNIFYDDYDLLPATPKGIMQHLEFIGYNLRGKNVIIFGRGNLVGKPLTTLMLNKGATVLTVNSKTPQAIKDYFLGIADVVILSTDVKGSAKSSQLAKDKDVLVYNVGTVFDDNGKLTTELEVDEDRDNIYYTNRIGAVGVCTVLSLMDNVVKSYKKDIDKTK